MARPDSLGQPADSAADLSALMLVDGQVRTQDDFVYFNQPATPLGEIRLTGGLRDHSDVGQALELDLSKVTSDITSIAIAVSTDGSGAANLAALLPISIQCLAGSSAEQHLFVPALLTDQSSAVLVEFYRRQGAWKLRAVGQGYADGLAGLIREFGVPIDDDDKTDSADETVAPGDAAAAIDWRNPPVPRGY